MEVVPAGAFPWTYRLIDGRASVTATLILRILPLPPASTLQRRWTSPTMDKIHSPALAATRDPRTYSLVLAATYEPSKTDIRRPQIPQPRTPPFLACHRTNCFSPPGGGPAGVALGALALTPCTMFWRNARPSRSGKLRSFTIWSTQSPCSGSPDGHRTDSRLPTCLNAAAACWISGCPVLRIALWNGVGAPARSGGSLSRRTFAAGWLEPHRDARCALGCD